MHAEMRAAFVRLNNLDPRHGPGISSKPGATAITVLNPTTAT
jgi:hypothetical protein